MRIDIRNKEEGRTGALGWSLAALVAFVALIAPPASAQVWFTQDALLSSFFEAGSRPASVEWTPSAAEVTAFKGKVGYTPPSKAYTWFVGAPSDATADLAIIDEQLGQHEPITFGVLLGADCAVKRVEILVYREAYGEGVRAAAFRDQFTGRKAADPMRAGKEIQIVSGATVSSRSLAVGVRRAAALCEVWQAR